MKEKMKAVFNRLKQAGNQHPIEVVLSVVLTLLACYRYETGFADDQLRWPLVYFPVLFLVSYTLNGLTLGKGWRGLYVISLFLGLPMVLLPPMQMWWTSTYLVSLIVVQLVYLVSRWKKDNVEFAQVALRYLKALLSAGLLASIAYGLTVSIYMSIRYIFEIWEGSERRVLAEAAYLMYICVMPWLFLMFNQEKEEKDDGRNRLFEVMLNYVLSPALLIYAAIIYLYFVKVALFWSLPKGGVAYIVVSFVIGTFILKGCQAFLHKRCYDWFYRYASLAVLPALVMYWIGVYYRINQYGFTEARVYLVVTGIILTGMAVMFFSKRWGRYLYVACLAIVCLSAVTYIPGITAMNIEIISQTARDNYPPKDVYDKYYNYTDIHSDDPVDISTWKTLVPVVGYRNTSGMWTTLENNTFYIFNNENDTLYSENITTLWNRQMAKAGLQPTDSIPQEAFPILLELDMDSAKLVFQNISVMRISSDSTYRVSYLTPGYYLKK